MKKFKPFIGAIIALIFALTLIAGSTYALFTNKAEDDVLITAGKVNVKTTIVKGSIKTYSADPSSGIYEKAYQIDDDDSDNAWPFANNGRVLFDDLSLSAITIDRMTPLDGVEFKVSFVPNSNVSIKYRTIIYVLGAEDTGLASALNYKIDGTTYYGMYESNKIYSKWKELIWDNETSSFTGDIADINFDITLPSYGYADDFQDKQCKLHIAIEAVQWNTIVVNPPEDLSAFIQAPCFISETSLNGYSYNLSVPSVYHEDAQTVSVSLKNTADAFTYYTTNPSDKDNGRTLVLGNSYNGWKVSNYLIPISPSKRLFGLVNFNFKTGKTLIFDVVDPTLTCEGKTYYALDWYLVKGKVEQAQFAGKVFTDLDRSKLYFKNDNTLYLDSTYSKVCGPYTSQQMKDYLLNADVNLENGDYTLVWNWPYERLSCPITGFTADQCDTILGQAGTNTSVLVSGKTFTCNTSFTFYMSVSIN